MKMRGWPNWNTSNTAVCATTEPKATIVCGSVTAGRRDIVERHC